MSSTRTLLLLLGAVATASCTACVARVQGEPRLLSTGAVLSVVVYPPWANVPPGQSQQFSADVTAPTGIEWSVDPAGVATITQAGLFSVPGTAVLGARYVVSARSTLDPTAVGTALVTVSPSQSTPGRYLGVNLGWMSPAQPYQLFANVLKQGRPWTNASDVLIPLDARGWPTRDGQIGFFESTTWPGYMAAPGYKLRFRGQANLGGSNILVTNKVYDAASNVTTADVAVTGVDNTWITFSSTRRLPADAAGTGITEVTLMRPGHALTESFNRDFVAAIQPFSAVRIMQSAGPGLDLWGTGGAVGVMGNRDTTWASRQKPTVGYAYNGPAWEDWVVLANTTGKDVWLTLPYHVDADYVTKLAQLLKYGSDGVNPYTTQTHDPATWNATVTSWFPGLLPQRKVYVEFVNELWNHGYGYPNSDENDADYSAEIAAGDPHHLNFDGRGDPDRRVAWKTVWLSQLFRAVWGSQMGTQVRIVLPNQGDWGGWDRHQNQLTYLEGVWGPGSAFATIDGITNPKQAPSYYVHNITGSMYIHADNTSTVDTAFADMNRSLKTDGGLGSESNSVFQRIAYAEALAARYPGIKFSSYEAGIEIAPSATMRAADADPRMKTLHTDFFTRFYAQPHADVLMYFWLVGDAAIDAGLSADLRNTSTPRWQAVKESAAGL